MKLRASSAIVLAALGIVVCVLAVGSAQGDENHSNEVAVEEQKGTLGGRFKLPKIFDFERFKAAFKKHYPSALAESLRQKIFLGRAFRAFTSWVAYKYGKTRSYLGINPLSDWTPEEVNRMYVAKIPEDLAPEEQHKAPVVEEIPAATLEAIEAGLQDAIQRKDKPGFAELAREVENIPKRNRRTVGGPRADVDVDDLFKDPATVERNVSRKYTSRIASNNPNYEPIEVTSYGATVLPEEQPIRFGTIDIGATIGYVANTLTSYLPRFWGATEPAEPAEPSMAPPAEDEVFFDHRDSGCLLEPRAQSNCGSCYAFSAIAAYEHALCVESNELVALSEQYYVDCGPKLPEGVLSGCDGGYLGNVGDFVDQYGLELRSAYPYKAVQDACPVVDLDSAGYLRTMNGNLYKVKSDKIAVALRTGPILTSITTYPGFSEYADGVADCSEKDKTGRHAMLIVGHGREDGQEYWLIRNSHGLYWGTEAGHYKLNVNTDCIKELYIIKAVFKRQSMMKRNPTYSGEGLKRKRRIEMLSDVLELHKKSLRL